MKQPYGRPARSLAGMHAPPVSGGFACANTAMPNDSNRGTRGTISISGQRPLRALRRLSASDPSDAVGAGSGLVSPGSVAPCFDMAAAARDDPSSTNATPMRFCAPSMLRISNAPVESDGQLLRPRAAAAGRCKRRCVRQGFDARLQLHEGAEIRDARDPTRAHLAHLVAGRHRRPGIVQELLEAERDFLCGLVHAQNLHGDIR